MPAKYALYDRHDKLYLVSSDGTEINHTFYNVLKTATMVKVGSLTDKELQTLSLPEVLNLIEKRRNSK